MLCDSVDGEVPVEVQLNARCVLEHAEPNNVSA